MEIQSALDNGLRQQIKQSHKHMKVLKRTCNSKSKCCFQFRGLATVYNSSFLKNRVLIFIIVSEVCIQNE